MFELEADVEVTVSVKATALEASADRKTWSPLPAAREGEWLVARLAPGRTFLRTAK